MIRFNCDYAEGAHPRILEKLTATNFEQSGTYGLDSHSDTAREYIRRACARPDADVHFLVGGTQANLTVIDAALLPYQGVVSAASGHINSHETGAVEATGRKVLALPSADGKITAAQVRDLCEIYKNDPDFEHTVQPGMVYISHPSENGTCYTRGELAALRAVCDEFSLKLFLDGARLGYGLMYRGADLTLPDIAALCDVFYIGGTKVGALFGEAVVITDPGLARGFRSCMKRRGAMLAKGRMLGIQFEALFEDGLYFDISRRADELADRLRAACRDLGLRFMYDAPANQLFPILPDDVIARLREKYIFFPWAAAGEGQSAVRFCISWCTPEDSVEQLIADMRAELA